MTDSEFADVILTLVASKDTPDGNEIERIDKIHLHSSILADCGFFKAQGGHRRDMDEGDGGRTKNKRRRTDARLAIFERLELFERMSAGLESRRHTYVIGGCHIKNEEGERKFSGLYVYQLCCLDLSTLL